MNLNVAGRHMDVTEAMKAYAMEKVGKLPHFYDSLQSADVSFAADAGEYVVEIIAHGKGKSTFVARHQGKDMYGCLDQCVHKLEQQVRKHKDRVRDRQGPTHEESTATPERE